MELISKSSSHIFNDGQVSPEKENAFKSSKQRVVIDVDGLVSNDEAKEIIKALRNVKAPFILYLETDSPSSPE